MTARLTGLPMCVSILLLAMASGGGQAAVTDEFDAGTAEWYALQIGVQEATVQRLEGISTTNDPQHVKSGAGALQFDYTSDKESLKVVGRFAPEMPKAMSLRFWAKADRDIPLGLLVSETDKSRYGFMLFLSKNTWQRVEVNLEDLVLAPGSVDENDRLDADALEIIAVGDATPQLAAQAALDPASAPYLQVELGPGTLWIDQFEVSELPVAPLHPRLDTPRGTAAILDSFGSGMLMWMLIMDPEYSFVPGDGDTCLELAYTPRPMIGMVYPSVVGLVDAETDVLTLKARCDRATMLMVGVQEADGSAYTARASIVPKEDWETIEFGLDQFTPAPQAPDANFRLDPAQIAGLMVLAGPATPGDTEARKLWLDDVAFLTLR
ncbi:MAG: hypothetical protein ACE5JM_15165 [Armatimonadota bacterium]